MGDYGCYCFLESIGTTLTLEDSHLSWGSWARTPPQSIPVHGSGAFHAKDNFGLAGTEGWVIYKAPDGARFKMSFACPFSRFSKNYARIECIGDACKNYSHRTTLRGGKAPRFDSDPAFEGGMPIETDDNHPVVVFYRIW